MVFDGFYKALQGSIGLGSLYKEFEGTWAKL